MGPPHPAEIFRAFREGAPFNDFISNLVLWLSVVCDQGLLFMIVKRAQFFWTQGPSKANLFNSKAPLRIFCRTKVLGLLTLMTRALWFAHFDSWSLKHPMSCCWYDFGYTSCQKCAKQRALLQSGASYLSHGFEDNVLGSSPGWLADTVATYCPGRPSQLTWKNIIKSCDR